MPPKPLSAIVLVCEKVLQEKDDLVSAIRIADLFFVPPPIAGVPLEQHAVLMNVLAMCKFAHDDESEHSLSLRLRRPDGTEKEVDFGIPLTFSLKGAQSRAPGAPVGYNLLGPWGVKATHMGLHRLTLLVDGEESAYTFFTLAPLPNQSA